MHFITTLLWQLHIHAVYSYWSLIWVSLICTAWPLKCISHDPCENLSCIGNCKWSAQAIICNLAKTRQPKVGSKLSPYSATSHSAKRRTKDSKRGHKVIFGIDWRVFTTMFVLNCMHMQAVVQIMQAVTKTALSQEQKFAISLLGRMQLLKQL